MTGPLRITAHLRGAFQRAPGGTCMLDAMLGSVIARRLGLAPPGEDNPPADLDIPIARDVATGVYLCSDVLGETEEYEVRFLNRRFPVSELIRHGDPARMGTVNPQLGMTKSKRVPMEVHHAAGSALRWYALGEASMVRDLLTDLTHVSRMRGHGFGEVSRWVVEPCEAWEGFPVVYQGRPLRALPTDWPGLAPHCQRDYRVLTPPYWWHAAERATLCVVPGEGEARPGAAA